MKPIEALQILEQATDLSPLPKIGHVKVQEAVAILRDFIAHHTEAKKKRK